MPHLTFKDKPVYKLSYKPNFSCNDPQYIWTQCWCYGKGNPSLALFSREELDKRIKKILTDLPGNKILYFGHSSKFPRFKLTDSNFKRCIKPEKADVCIINNESLVGYGTWNNIHLLEDDGGIYMVDDIVTPINGFRFRDFNQLTEFQNNPIKFILKYKISFWNNLREIDYVKTATAYPKDFTEDANLIMDGTYKKISTDAALDTCLTNTFESMTFETLTSICEMLDSPDKATQGIGLKLLCNYNINDIKITIRTILGLRKYLADLPEWKSVAVQQLLTTIHWTAFGSIPTHCRPMLQGDVPSGLDKEFCRKLYLDAIKNYVDNYLRGIMESTVLQVFDIKLTYDVS